MNTFNRIAIIGLGYIGLPAAVAFARCGKSVLGVDINPDVVTKINQGRIHFVEPQLEESVKQAVENGLLFATQTPDPADVFVIAVPTPLTYNHQPDLQYIKQAVKAISPYLVKGNLIVLESTSPVGTTEKLAKWLQKLRPDLSFPTQGNDNADIYIAYCPERVLPGRVMIELFENDRVIGGLTAESTRQAVDLYRIFVKGECIATDARTAEMCKLTENSFRDVNLAFANELSMICDKLNINVWELIRLANRHPRVNILQPGAGVGGHCIAVDPWFIAAQTPDQSRLIRTAREVNDSKPQWVIEKVKQALADCVNHRNCLAGDVTIACLGLSFKADIDDLRGSPALAITQYLADWHRGVVLAVEPHINALPPSLRGKVELVGFEQAIKKADILLLLVDHTAFKNLSPDTMSVPWLIDTKGIWSQL